MKKFLSVLILTLLMSNVSYAEMIMPAQSIENEVVKVEKTDEAHSMLNQIRKDRNTIYNVLNLTPTQIQKTKDIEQQRFEEITPLVDNLMTQKRELRTLRYQEASNRELNPVKKKINKLSKQIKKSCDKYDKYFEKILTSQQRSKYNMVQKLRFEDFSKYKKFHSHKKQSDLRPFGVPISQPAYQEELRVKNSFKNKCKNFFKKN